MEEICSMRECRLRMCLCDISASSQIPRLPSVLKAPRNNLTRNVLPLTATLLSLNSVIATINKPTCLGSFLTWMSLTYSPSQTCRIEADPCISRRTPHCGRIGQRIRSHEFTRRQPDIWHRYLFPTLITTIGFYFIAEPSLLHHPSLTILKLRYP
jgi:hypothetical protein